MRISEKRNDLLQRITDLDDHQFEKIYSEMIAVIQHNKPYELTKEEDNAIDEALKNPEEKRRLTKNQVVAEAKKKYPKLKFK
jgi:hypothetical protein